MTEELPDFLSDEAGIKQFGVTCLQLCQASYAIDPSEVPDWVAKVQPFTGTNVWSCGSGAWQSDADDINLAFVASYGPAGGTPVAYALVIRGTDADGPDAWSIVNQLYEDVDVTWTGPIPWSSDPDSGYIAGGTSDAYTTVSAFNFGELGGTLQGYVLGLIKENKAATGTQPFLYVIGHSLGGCLASVFGPDMGAALEGAGLQKKVISATFAAPTAGDQVFVDEAAPLCAVNYRYRNTYDIVPRAWAGLGTMSDLYSGWGIGMDTEDWAVLKLTIGALDLSGKVYIQPEANQPLTGPRGMFFPAPSNPWRAQAEFQHHTSTYMLVLGGTNLWDLPTAGADARSKFGRA